MTIPCSRRWRRGHCYDGRFAAVDLRDPQREPPPSSIDEVPADQLDDGDCPLASSSAATRTAAPAGRARDAEVAAASQGLSAMAMGLGANRPRSRSPVDVADTQWQDEPTHNSLEEDLCQHHDVENLPLGLPIAVAVASVGRGRPRSAFSRAKTVMPLPTNVRPSGQARSSKLLLLAIHRPRATHRPRAIHRPHVSHQRVAWWWSTTSGDSDEEGRKTGQRGRSR